MKTFFKEHALDKEVQPPPKPTEEKEKPVEEKTEEKKEKVKTEL